MISSGLDGTGLDWAGLGLIRVNQTRLVCIELDWNGLDWFILDGTESE